MKWLLKLPRDRQLMLVAGICVGLLALDRFVIQPLSDGWQSRQEQIDTAALAVARDTRLAAQAERWATWEREAEAKRLPASRSAAESALITQVDGWAREADLKLTSIRPRWQMQTNGETRLELHIGGSGALAAVTAFLHAAETAPLAIAVDNLELSSHEENGSSLTLSLRISAISADATEVTR